MKWLVLIVVGLTACDAYDSQTNADFFELFADGFASSVNSVSAREAEPAIPKLGTSSQVRLLPAPETADATVACDPGELQLVADVPDNIDQNGNGYVAVNVTAMTVPPPGNNNDRGCVVDGTDISGYMQLIGSETIDNGTVVPPTFGVNGSWTADNCGCCVQLSLSAAQGWNGSVCGVAVVGNTIQDGDPVCAGNCGG